MTDQLREQIEHYFRVYRRKLDLLSQYGKDSSIWLNHYGRLAYNKFIDQVLALVQKYYVELDDDDKRIYPCDKCGKLRSKNEGGTTFTVCDECWDKHFCKVKGGE